MSSPRFEPWLMPGRSGRARSPRSGRGREPHAVHRRAVAGVADRPVLELRPLPPRAAGGSRSSAPSPTGSRRARHREFDVLELDQRAPQRLQPSASIPSSLVSSTRSTAPRIRRRRLSGLAPPIVAASPAGIGRLTVSCNPSDDTVGMAVLDERPLAGTLVAGCSSSARFHDAPPVAAGRATARCSRRPCPSRSARSSGASYAAARKDWRRRPAGSSMPRPWPASLCTAVATHDTGGANSPARFLLILVLVFSTYFFPSERGLAVRRPRARRHALPFPYDADALGGGAR